MLVFPGQGAQYVGMGREFYESSKQAKAVFDQADQILNNGLSDVIFNGPAEKLTATAYCQPAILTFSIAALKAFRAHPKFKNIVPQFSAGLSLGEYSALAAAESISFEDTLRLVERRASLMEKATKLQAGKMAAVIGLDQSKILTICTGTGAEVANFNSPQQIVITGSAHSVLLASEESKKAGAKSVIPLEVSGAFHSSLMRPAQEKFALELKKVKFHPPQYPIVCNVDGKPTRDPKVICQNLSLQITSSVKWVDTILNIAQQGVKDFIEIGPGKVLTGLIRRIDRGVNVFNIERPADIYQLPF